MNEKDRKLADFVAQIAKQEYDENLRLIAECKEILLRQSIPDNKKTPFLLFRAIGEHYESTRRMAIHMINEIVEKSRLTGKELKSKDEIDKEIKKFFADPRRTWKARAAAVIEHAGQILDDPADKESPTAGRGKLQGPTPEFKRKIQAHKMLDDLNFGSHRDAVPFDRVELVSYSGRYKSSDGDLITELMKWGEKEFVRKCNVFQFNKLLGLVSHFEEQKKELSGSAADVLSGVLQSLDSLKGQFVKWFVENGYDIPENPLKGANKVTDSGLSELGSRSSAGVSNQAKEHKVLPPTIGPPGLSKPGFEDLYRAISKKYGLPVESSEFHRKLAKALASMTNEQRENWRHESESDESFRQKVLETRRSLSPETVTQLSLLTDELKHRKSADDIFLGIIEMMMPEESATRDYGLFKGLLPDYQKMWSYIFARTGSEIALELFDTELLRDQIDVYRQEQLGFLLHSFIRRLNPATKEILLSLQKDYNIVEPSFTLKELAGISCLPEGAYLKWEKEFRFKIQRKLDDAEVELLKQRGLALPLIPEPSSNKTANMTGAGMDQDPEILKFKRICEELELPLKKTIPRETLFEIMCEIGQFSGTLDQFTTKCPAYSKGREYASRLKYSRKGSSLFEN